MYMLTFVALMSIWGPSLADIDDDKCPQGYGYMLGQCVKKFVLPERIRCPTPDLKFGQYDLQFDGRIVSYWCEDGWTLVPEEFDSAACKLGNWSKPQPQCVRPGCDEVKAPEDGEMEIDLEGALVTFRCNQPLELSGEPVIGCDGQFWNASVPRCVLPKTSKASFNHLEMHTFIVLLFSLMHYYYS